jgi:death-on-curing protein
VTGIAYLDLEDLLGLVRALQTGPVRDIGLLAAAAGRPQASAFGEDAYPTLALKAGALLHSLAGNHALVDGTKRLAWLAPVVFLGINGSASGLDDEAAFALVMDVAASDLGAEQIAERLRVRAS